MKNHQSPNFLSWLRAVLEGLPDGQCGLDGTAKSADAQIEYAKSRHQIARHYDFIQAAAEGNVATVKQYLADGMTDVNATNAKGLTALICAVKAKMFWAVKLLLSSPTVNVNYEDNTGSTALSYALRNNDLVLSEMLLRANMKSAVKDQGLTEMLTKLNECRQLKDLDARQQMTERCFDLIDVLLRAGASPTLPGLRESVKSCPSICELLNSLVATKTAANSAVIEPVVVKARAYMG
jgi:ankyrin repeat protein